MTDAFAFQGQSHRRLPLHKSDCRRGMKPLLFGFWRPLESLLLEWDLKSCWPLGKKMIVFVSTTAPPTFFIRIETSAAWHPIYQTSGNQFLLAVSNVYTKQCILLLVQFTFIDKSAMSNEMCCSAIVHWTFVLTFPVSQIDENSYQNHGGSKQDDGNTNVPDPIAEGHEWLCKYYHQYRYIQECFMHEFIFNLENSLQSWEARWSQQLMSCAANMTTTSLCLAQFECNSWYI